MWIPKRGARITTASGTSSRSNSNAAASGFRVTPAMQNSPGTRRRFGRRRNGTRRQFSAVRAGISSPCASIWTAAQRARSAGASLMPAAPDITTSTSSRGCSARLSAPPIGTELDRIYRIERINGISEVVRSRLWMHSCRPHARSTHCGLRSTGNRILLIPKSRQSCLVRKTVRPLTPLGPHQTPPPSSPEYPPRSHPSESPSAPARRPPSPRTHTDP